MTPLCEVGVSVVVPVRNGAATVHDALTAIGAELIGRQSEIVVIDDGSEDASRAIVDALARTLPIRVIEGLELGAAAAINYGIAEAQFPVIAQIDQDVVIEPGWLDRMLAALAAPDIAAVQGHYVAAAGASWSARTMGVDLAQRYRGLDGGDLDHVCTGNTVYRRSALHQVGLFDEELGYGYDNDLSYRLRRAGYRLALCRSARSVHYWRDGLSGYLRQQYGFGYGRLDLVAKHPDRLTGDRVSPPAMMAHPLLMTIAIASAVVASLVAAAGGDATIAVGLTGAIVLGLVVERFVAGIRAVRQSGDPAGWLFVPLHLLRDVAWVWAMAVWLTRRVRGVTPRPPHSMAPRSVSIQRAGLARRGSGERLRVLALIPAHNERENLASVIADLRTEHPELDILVIDDGSTDGTADLLPHLGVAWLRLSQRLGVGSAVRAGVSYALRRGYTATIRVDGDGQHGADDVSHLLSPIAAGEADVVLGSRFVAMEPDRRSSQTVRACPAPTPLQRGLALCLSGITGTRVSDPTSGFYALGPSAMRMLSDHHPTGYPEPELRLLLSRTSLRVREVAVQAWPRRGGRTSLTPLRLVVAALRVVLAMVIVPLRGRVGERA